MPLNLVTNPWLGIRRANGAHDWITPADLLPAGDASLVVALAFPRPDFNAAVLEFLIGLFTVAMLPADDDGWSETAATPPSPDEAAAKLATLAPFFNLDGEGVRAFQDIDALEPKDETDIAAMLIDAPGGQTEKQNADLFIKRGQVTALSLPMAAAALITLQTYAPAGGAGHRTSLRGGGPLTTLVRPPGEATLWDLIWANVPTRASLADLPGWTYPFDLKSVFPWAAATRESTGAKGTTSLDVHPLQCFFGLPRRIRLDVTPAAGGACSLGGPTGDMMVRSFRMRPYGVNYAGAWLHPLSPYRLDKKSGEKLPLHPNPGSLSYRHWLGLVGLGEAGGVEAALTVKLGAQRYRGHRPRLSAFGFDMDNMKARAWADQTMPLYAAVRTHARDLARLAEALIGKAEEAAKSLSFAVKLARFGKRKAEPSKSGAPVFDLPPSLKGDFSFITDRFWRETEHAFVTLMGRAMGETEFVDAPLIVEWGDSLKTAALEIFDDLVEFGTPGLGDYARPIVARRGLVNGLDEKVRGITFAVRQARKQKAAANV